METRTRFVLHAAKKHKHPSDMYLVVYDKHDNPVGTIEIKIEEAEHNPIIKIETMELGVGRNVPRFEYEEMI